MHVLSDISVGHADREITTDDLLAALRASGAQDRPLVGEWSWDELILSEATKRELIELQRLIEDPERATRFGIQPPRGALLYGPPGTGKTMIAKVLAAQAHTSFYPVSGSEIISKWLGESEQNVAKLWERARGNAPSIIFLDEIDAIAPRRGGGIGSGADQAVSRVVNQLLQEIDGIASGSGVFVLGATNLPEMLDEALLRGGRLARQIEVPLPDLPQRFALFELFTGSMHLRADVDLHVLASATTNYSGADIQALCQQAGIRAMMAEAEAVASVDFRHALEAAGTASTAPPPDLGLCDWHGPDTPTGCDASAIVEVGRRQYCGVHAVALRARSDQASADSQRYQA
jgi:transitional endoplasmic reticulum ATPase